MPGYIPTEDEGQGNPNLSFLQYIMKNFGKAQIALSNYINTNWTPAKITSTKHVVIFVVDADAKTTALPVPGVPLGAVILNVHVICEAAKASGTLTLRIGSAGTAITNAMIMAVDKTVVNAGTIDTDENVVTAAGLEVIAHSVDDRGTIVIEFTQ